MAWQGQFVYHQLAPGFRGTVLYPLNQLATVYPDIHAREAPKYAGREAVMSYRVPHLDAPSADTVNLSTLDPRLLVAARARLGIAASPLLGAASAADPDRAPGRAPPRPLLGDHPVDQQLAR